jgi:hypothetical protein
VCKPTTIWVVHLFLGSWQLAHGAHRKFATGMLHGSETSHVRHFTCII